MTMHHEKTSEKNSKETNKPSKESKADCEAKEEYETCVIYTRKTAIFGDRKEINDNCTQRMKCELIINEGYKFIVSSKRYDDNELDIEDVDKRPALQELFTDIEAGLVTTVVVHTLYTFSANFKDIDEILKIFKKHDVRIILAWHGLDSATREGRRFFMQIAELVMMEGFANERDYLRWKHDEE